MELTTALLTAVSGSAAEPFELKGGQGVMVASETIHDVLAYLKNNSEFDFDMLADLTAADFSASDGCIHVVYVLSSVKRKVRLVVKTKVSCEQPKLSTVSDLWHSANWAEREVWDMFGVEFEGHPDLRRILLYPEFVGHPLLKSYPVDKRQPLVEERDPIADPWPSRDQY